MLSVANCWTHRFLAAWADGQRKSLEDAIAYAMEDEQPVCLEQSNRSSRADEGDVLTQAPSRAKAVIFRWSVQSAATPPFG